MKGDREVKWVYFHGFINNTYGIIIIDNLTQLIKHSWLQITQNIQLWDYNPNIKTMDGSSLINE